jgi:PAS domain S-box-containing protein
MFFLTKEEGLGRGWLTRIHPEDADAVITGWSAALRAGVEYGHEYRLVAPEGGTRWVHCRAAPLLDGAGGIVGTVGTVEDITERRVLETQLRQAQKMEAVGRLAGGVAHDFNNLLTIISGNTAFARAALPPDSQAARDLAEVDEASRRAAALTRQLLAFSRKQVLHRRRLDVNECVQELERMLCRLIGEDVRIELQLEPAIWPILADPGQLEQVVINLVVNARDAMPDGGTVRITTANVRLDASTARAHGGLQPGAFVSLAVTDDGLGIPASVLPHIFEPFYTTKGLGQGTGLGLATVYGIVKQSGGQVAVESGAARGTSFTIMLPCDDSAELPAPSVAPSIATGGRETVLVVEDDDAVRSVIRRMLARNGYRVLEAVNGAEALRLWRARRGNGSAAAGEHIDLVLVDAVMPVMGGREVIEQLRADDPEARVVLMTGYTDDIGGAEAALAAGGVSGFLQKPLSEEVLLEQIRSTIDASPRAVS